MDSNNLSQEEILKISRDLVGLKISEIVDINKTSNKGDIGMAIENQIFNLPNNSRHEADFPQAGVELKVIPLRQLKNGTLVPKERLVLSMINYFEDYKYPFENSSVYNKTKLMQIIQYNHDYHNKFNSKIINAFQYSFPKIDLEILKNDYEIIRSKIKSGLAHNLSEGDTLYLGACRKGAGKNKDLVDQPFSDTKAKSRAFSLKASYLKLMNERKSKLNEAIFSFTELASSSYNFEAALKIKLQKYIGRNLNDLIEQFQINGNSKNAIPSLLSKMLNIKCKIQNSEEFIKANIKARTIRLINNKPKEDISFKAIDFNQIIAEEWDDYWLREEFETQKYAFIIFSGNNVNNLKFQGIKIWHMPENDINEFKEIFEDTKRKCQVSGLVYKENGKFRNGFLKSTQTRIGHLRPHAKDSKDTIVLPSGDIIPKQSFWLNKKYIKKIFEKISL